MQQAELVMHCNHRKRDALQRRTVVCNDDDSFPSNQFWYEDALKSAHRFEGARRVWAIHACLAATYGQLDKKEEAGVEITQLLKLRPEFNEDPKGYLQRFFGSLEGVEILLDGLRKGGFNFRDDSTNNQ